MGNTACIIDTIYELDKSNWIDIVTLIVNSLLAIWIVTTIQNKLNNKRVLKDYLIKELVDLRQEYRDFFTKVQTSTLEVKDVLPWFKLMNMKVTDLMNLVHKEYGIDKDTLKPFQDELRDLTTDSPEYISLYATGGQITFSQQTLILYTKFQQDHVNKFNALVVSVNNAA